MKITVLAALALGLTTAAANAAIDIVQVPAMCGPSADVMSALAVRMPNPESIGKGGNSKGTQVATLFTDAANGYWALLASTTPEEVCVVASGFNWTTDSVKAF